MASSLSRVPVPGFGDLAEAIGRGLPDVELGAVVTAVDTTVPELIEVSVADGRAWTARAVVLAVPVNVLPSIAFVPRRPASVTRVAGREHGRVDQARRPGPRRRAGRDRGRPRRGA